MHASLGSIRCPLLIGRDDLLDLADGRLDDVSAGHGQFLLLAGEAGIGKTRLLEAIRRKAAGRGMPTVVGSVAPQDRDVPAASLMDLARSMSRVGPLELAGVRLLELLGSPPASGLAGRRRMVMDAVDVILDAIPGPTMLAFEDLQWTDDLSLEVIGELARRSREEPWRPLTAREFAVARLISDGLTNAEIASELGIAPKTASSHVEHILAKLGASRRAEIAAWASRVEPSAVAR